jgi:hypothetical protein
VRACNPRVVAGITTILTVALGAGSAPARTARLTVCSEPKISGVRLVEDSGGAIVLSARVRVSEGRLTSARVAWGGHALTLADLAPRRAATLRFEHVFARPGAHRIALRVDANGATCGHRSRALERWIISHA